jgi:hypothetical protein
MSYATNSYGNYNGTIIISPIRPAGPNESIATVFSNEIKGGHHTYELLSERDSIIENRRDWGMICTVYNDTTSSNNKSYILQYNYVNTNILDNSNWIDYNPSDSLNYNVTSEWLDSVQELATSPITLTDGYRYLVDDSGIGVFAGQDGKIAIYSTLLSSFTFSEPNNGTTIRIDDKPNVLYKYQGTFSSGNWYKEYLNQIRYVNADSVDGMSFSATSSQTPIDLYENNIFYVEFSMTSSGTSSISVDSLNHIEIKKLENNNLNSLTSNDIVPNIVYQLIYNNGVLQTVLPSSSTTTIGPAEDGDYTDGLYIDFTTSTLIGTPIDRFNELLKNLVPPMSPTLSSWSSVGSFVNGSLSFDNSTSGSLVTATQSPYGSVAKGETYSNLDSSYRLGITSKVIQPITGTAYYSDISGILNIDVPYNQAYATYSFGYANSGTISLMLNGITISSIGLTGGAVDTTLAGATSGLDISIATASKFINGNNFDMYQNRTGTYLIKNDNGNIVSGYNYLVVNHDSYILDRYEFVSDDSVLDISVATPEISVVIISTVYISGIEYYNNLYFVYDSTIQNAFNNTYNNSNSAVEYRDVSVAISGVTNSVTNTVTNSATASIFEAIEQYSPLIVSGAYDPTATMLSSMTFSINKNVRRINDSVGFAMTILRTVQGTFLGGTSQGTNVSTDNWFIDNYEPMSSSFSESFSDEDYRLLNKSDKYNSYHLTTDIAINPWRPNYSLLTDTDNYNGLQVINGMLVYPNFNFSNTGPGDITTNPNYGLGSSRNYNNCFTINTGIGTYSSSPATNYRSYTRWFNLGSYNYTKLKLNVYYEDTNFINSYINLSNPGAINPNTDAWLEIKIPYSTGVVPGGTQSNGAVTGWLDSTKPFDGIYSDGSGCLSGDLPVSSGDDWMIDFGIKGTEYSGGYVLLRITVGPDYIGNINKIDVIGI